MPSDFKSISGGAGPVSVPGDSLAKEGAAPATQPTAFENFKKDIGEKLGELGQLVSQHLLPSNANKYTIDAEGNFTLSYPKAFKGEASCRANMIDPNGADVSAVTLTFEKEIKGKLIAKPGANGPTIYKLRIDEGIKYNIAKGPSGAVKSLTHDMLFDNAFKAKVGAGWGVVKEAYIDIKEFVAYLTVLNRGVKFS